MSRVSTLAAKVDNDASMKKVNVNRVLIFDCFGKDKVL